MDNELIITCHVHSICHLKMDRSRRITRQTSDREDMPPPQYIASASTTSTVPASTSTPSPASASTTQDPPQPQMPPQMPPFPPMPQMPTGDTGTMFTMFRDMFAMVQQYQQMMHQQQQQFMQQYNPPNVRQEPNVPVENRVDPVKLHDFVKLVPEFDGVTMDPIKAEW